VCSQNAVNKLVRLIALLYAARKCKQNKRYHTSARLTLAYKKIPHVRKVNYFRSRDGRTDRRTDRQTDRVRRNMLPPPREEGRIININTASTLSRKVR